MNSNRNPQPMRLAIGGMLALVVAMGIGRFVYTPILPMMVDEIGLSASQAGMIASSNYAGYLVGAIVAATSFLKGSRRTWMLVALMASAFTTLLMGWANSYIQFMALRFVAGVFSAWVLVFSSALIIDRLISAGRGQLSAMHFAGVGVGIIVASILTTLAAVTEGNWSDAWLYNGIFALLLVSAVTYLVAEGESAVIVSSFTPVANRRPIKWLLSAYGLFGFGYVITATFIIQMVRSSNYSLAVETWVWVLVGLAGIPSVWFWNKVANRIGNSKAFAIACICEAFGVGASVLVVNLGGLIFAAIFLGGTIMGITALGLVEARTRSIDDPRRALAMMTAAFGFGQIVGPMVAGYTYDASGSFLLPSLLASAALAAAAVLVQIRGPADM